MPPRFIPKSLVFVPLVLAAFSFSCSCTQAESRSEQPHIVFIMVDDMGYGDPGCFNPESKIRTPNIDSVATNGLRFTDAHAPGPLCHMSRYGLMTGKYPFRTNVGVWPKKPLIAPGQTTVASMLHSQGYKTAMVGKWHLGFAENGYNKALPGGPVDVGFDSFFGIRASTDIPPYFYIRDRHAVKPPTEPIAAKSTPGWSPIQGEFWREGLIAKDMELHDVLPRFTDEAIEVIEQSDASEPMFLYLAYPAPHTPWLPSEEFAGKSKAGLYGDFAEMVDSEIGRVLAALNDSGHAENTLLIITSDNGPVWYEVDVEKFGHASVGPLRGMKADAWEGGHRMPMVVSWPGVVEAGGKSDRLVSFVDVFATLADVTEYELMDSDCPDSFSFADQLSAKFAVESPRRELALKSGRGLMVFRDAANKLIDGPGSGGFSGGRGAKRRNTAANAKEYQLYDLASDLGESNNLAADSPERVETMLKRLRAVEDAAGHRFMQ